MRYKVGDTLIDNLLGKQHVVLKVKKTYPEEYETDRGVLKTETINHTATKIFKKYLEVVETLEETTDTTDRKADDKIEWNLTMCGKLEEFHYKFDSLEEALGFIRNNERNTDSVEGYVIGKERR
jgi:hypothetical protein